MNALLAAFQFLTVLPAVVRRPFSPQELGRAAGWFPLVGLVLGGALLGLQAGLSAAFPTGISAALVVLAWIVLTRALHFDGFVDMCDALFGGFTSERRLEILKDSHIGAFGLAGGVLLLLLKYSALAYSGRVYPGLLLAPLLGRWVLCLALFFYPYARQRGLGRDMKDNVRWGQVLLSTLLSVSAAWFFGGLAGIIAAGLACLTLALGAWFTLHRIPGLTGDSYGALCEMTELVILLFFLAGASL